MLIYVADDEPLLLNDLKDAVLAAEPVAKVKAFEWAQPLLDEIKCRKDNPDIVFLDIEMPEISGIELAKELKRISPGTKLIFVTGFTQYATEAFSIHADGYVMKPVTADKIRGELKHLRPMLKQSSPKRIRCQCFGNFEVYLDDAPMHFQYSRTKELFAYLISRNGALCSNGELMAMLWGDESGEDRKKEYFKKLRMDLRNQLENRGLSDVLVQQRGMLGIDAREIDCDYYEWLSGKSENVCHGEFMNQYSWGELLVGNITQ